jgi:hypothetical protein
MFDALRRMHSLGGGARQPAAARPPSQTRHPNVIEVQPERDRRATSAAYASRPTQSRLRELEITMDATHSPQTARSRYELRIASLFHEGRGFAFPCNADGQVDPAALSDGARRTLAAALAAVGRDYATPTVRPALAH